MRDFDGTWDSAPMKDDAGYPAIYYKLVGETGIDPVAGPPILSNQMVSQPAPAGKSTRTPRVRKAATAPVKATGGLARVK